MQEVPVPPLALDRFRRLLGQRSWSAVQASLLRSRRNLEGRTVWHVNSTARGGGVAELLQSVLGYLGGAGIETRWVVIEGDAGFFEVTKRIHNLLHGAPGDGGPLGPSEMRLYDRALAGEARRLESQMGAGDVVILHDPQAVGLAPALRRRGAQVIWACHIGTDVPNDRARQAWERLLPYTEGVANCVFSRAQYAWEGLEQGLIRVIPPCLDAFSVKNQSLTRPTVDAILQAAGLALAGAPGRPAFRRRDGSSTRLETPALAVQEEMVPEGAQVVTQISRWDPLKDHRGVMAGFVGHVPSSLGAHLVLAGPDPGSVADDPEGQATFDDLAAAWARLPSPDRRRVHIACLPMRDLEENAAIVNALQRRSQVVVQKSLAEGFGLTVLEAMWKSRPVVGSRTGGIQDQIESGRTGVLIDDPRDPRQLGGVLTRLLEDRRWALAMGRRARARVREEYLAPQYLGRYLGLIDPLVEARGAA